MGEHDKNGKFKDERSLKVNLRVRVQKGLVMVNEKETKPNVVIAFHMHSQIDIIGKNARVLKHSMAPIVVRVLVMEEKLSSSQLTTTVLRVQAEIRQVEGKKVKQITVKEINIKIDNNKNELLAERKIVEIELKEAEIHKRPHKNDHHIHCHRKGGHLPDSPYSMGKPRLPEHPYHGDKTRHSKHGKKSFCSAFHKLPFGARLAIFITIAVV